MLTPALMRRSPAKAALQASTSCRAWLAATGGSTGACRVGASGVEDRGVEKGEITGAASTAAAADCC